jgi:predicted GNAT family N-acyltransferase
VNEYLVRRAHWPEDADALRVVRFEVFVTEQGVPAELEMDREDPDALHLLAIDRQSHPIGTGRLLADGHIGRMAVARAWRGRGVGSRILQGLLDNARAAGLHAVFLHAQRGAEGFYRSAGFRTEGGEFLDAGIAHVLMHRTLN